MTVQVLYEDNHLLVVVKPPDIPVQEDDSGALDLLRMLKAYIKEKYQKPGNVFLGLVHRLDRRVGGVMVFARTSKAAARLSEQIRQRSTDKQYLAVVTGCPQNPRGRLTDYLLKDTRTNTVSVVPPNTPEAKEAILDYEVLKTRGDLSLVRIHLHTGRAHQIRVQMAHMGTPLYGDAKYSGIRVPPETPLALWANELSFNHPISKESMTFQSLPPEHYPWSLFKRD